MDAGQFLDAVYKQFICMNDGMVHATLTDIQNMIDKISIAFREPKNFRHTVILIWHKSDYWTKRKDFVTYIPGSGKSGDFIEFSTVESLKETLKDLDSHGFKINGKISVDFNFISKADKLDN